MDDLRAWYREGLVAGIHALEESREAVRGGHPEAADSTRRLAQLLHGNATLYGFEDVARAAAELSAREQVAPGDIDRLLSILEGVAAPAGRPRVDILLIEDDPVTSRVVAGSLEDGRRHVTVVRTGEEAKAWLARTTPALILLDLGLPDMDGRTFLLWLRHEAAFAAVPVIVLTGKGALPARSECIALGADEYMPKPFDPASLKAAAMAHLRHGTRRQPARLAEDDEQTAFQGLVGTSRVMREVYHRLELAAPTEVTILLTGESGTGKEMAARAMHDLSRRRDKRFVAVNCAALTETLLESELFGHVRGAFTDAVRDKVGVFQSADGGTLFLDEIGDLSPLLQLKLLRVLQEREVRRVGDDKPVRVDVRLVAATNKDLRGLLSTRAIRDDFYYRIRVFEVRMPPLRDRREDIPVLVHHFLGEFEEARRKRVRGVTREALAALQDYPWPGNVRELRNAIEHALVTVQGPLLELLDLPAEVRAWIPRRGNGAKPAGGGTAVDERARILDALAQNGGHRLRAAKALGINRITLWKKMRKYGLAGADGGGGAGPEPGGTVGDA